MDRTQRYKQKRKKDRSVLSRFRPAKIGSSARSIGGGVAELIGSDDTDPEPRAFDRTATKVYTATVDIDRPDPNTEDYWTEYRENPIISTQIQSLASDVFEPGWWITAASDDTQDEITEFCNNIGISGGKPHQPLTELGKMCIVQYKVRGTVLGEKVTDERDRHVAVNLVNPTTVEIYTKSGVNILVPPDYEPNGSDDAVKMTADGKAAAYVQFDQSFSRWKDRKERKFARDEMLHWVREPDIGDVRGNSVIEPVYERSRALRDKLQDNDLAISRKAWPMILFQLGSADYPWTEDEQKDFMKKYDKQNLGPGSFQGVPGDVQIHEFAGETADIQEHVMTDVDMIVSGLPGPKYALGSFEESGDPETHERQYKKLVRLMRRELEDLFTPYLVEVAESWGYDTEDLELHIGRPDGEVAPEDIQGSIIRYQSDVDDNGEAIQPIDDGSPEMVGDGAGTEDEGGDSGNEESGRTAPSSWSMEELARPDLVFAVEEELNDPRIVSTTTEEEALGEEISHLLKDARDRTLDDLELRHSKRNLPSGSDVSDRFENNVLSVIREEGFVRTVNDHCDTVLDATTDSLSSTTHSPQIDVSPRAEHVYLTSDISDSIVDDVIELGNRMSVEIKRQADAIANSDYDIDAIADRIRDVYSDGIVDSRGHIISRMRTQELVNRTKLDEYRRHEDVDGVKLISRCAENTHWMTAELAACDGGDPVVAWFESDRPLGEQFQDALSADPPQGFDPLPDVPPFHFGDRAEIAPVTEDDFDGQ